MTSQPSARPTSTGRPIAIAALAGLIACAAALQFTGAADKLQLLDPGATVRWGLPLATMLFELSIALTVGLLLLGGLLMPEGAKTARRFRVGRYAAWSALSWAFFGVVSVVLGYADDAGVRVGSSGFWTGVWRWTWQLELLRNPAITALVGLAIAIACFAGAGRDGQAWLFFGALVSLWPLALVGHAAGSNDHDAAVNSLAFHLLGVALWVGGLLAILLMWPRLGKGAPDVVARFSAIATWCYAIVGLSGLLNAWIRLGGFGGLDSRYSVIALAKVAALLALGVLGWFQRHRVVDRLRVDSSSKTGRAAFGRLAALEGLVMVVAIGLGAALSRSQPPVSGQSPLQKTDIAFSLTDFPTPAPLVTSSWFAAWRVEWLFTAVAVIALGVYLHWVWRLHRRGDKWPVARTVWWICGWACFVYFVDGAPAIYGHVVFSMHMLMHMGVSMLVPICLVRGGIVTLAMRALPKRSDGTLGPREILLAVMHSRIFGFFANPVIAATLSFGTLIAFYYSPWFYLSLTTHTGHVLMVTHFMITGYVYAYSLVGIDPGPKRWAPPIRMLVLLIAIAFHAFFGVAMMTGTTLLAPDFFSVLHLSWVPNPLVDQQRAGTVAWGAGEFPTFMFAMLIASEWYRSDRAAGERAERQAARDGDAELNAYNDYLAARARAEATGSRTTERD
ncbi:cytochrome c oxidase assembly protein [Flexivirga caeni]|uniref:Cytochrome C oxidase assembly protein n=1 Tax=Flexivirga caeni TaxID=2294115 RepID=A0A3M9MIS4_9MICO|nr:cytochrome c oxidase assembly protein [Flexivirga caeni]RNI25404.1 cytochrome C oxidase assembly protein [Flexivirga caeni]